MEVPGEALASSSAHCRSCHNRWLEKHALNDAALEGLRRPGEQCGVCRFFVPLTGFFINDWGACTNGASEFDGRVMLEHWGCAHFQPAVPAWSYVYPADVRQYWSAYCKRHGTCQ